MTLRMIRTDWLATKSHHWRLLIMVAIVAVFIVAQMSFMLIPISVFMAMAFSTNTFAVEEKGKLDHLFLTMPIARRTVVRGRFAFMIIAVVLAMAISGAVIALTLPELNFAVFTIKLTPSVIWLLCAFAAVFAGLESLCMYPTLFGLGYTKGKVWGLYIPMGLFGCVIGSTGALLGVKPETVIGWAVYWYEHALWVGVLLFMIALVLISVSYSLSVALYNKRDL